MDELKTVLLVTVLLGIAACGPKLELEPAGELYEGVVVRLDPDARVPFGAAPGLLAPTVESDGEVLTFDPPLESVAERWEAILVKEGETFTTPLAEGETRLELPKKTERVGVRAVNGELRGPVHWPAGTGSESQGLDSPAGFTWTIDPAWPPQQLEMRAVQLDLSLLDPSGDDLVGTARLTFEPLVALTALELGVLGTVSAVRDGSGAPLTFAPGPDGVTVDLAFSRPAGSTVTLEIDWRVASFSQSRSGRTVADATAELVYAGDGVDWFPRPADLPSGAITFSIAVEAPDAFRVHTGGSEVDRVAAGAGRSVTTRELSQPLRAWPLLAAGAYQEAGGPGGLTLAALASGGPDLVQHTAELATVLAFYVERFGPLPGGEIAMVQVPDAFGVGYSGPGLVLLPTVRWDQAPSTWSRFLLAHELSHAWWAHASFVADLRDAWLIEGLADYCAHRALELLAGPDAARAHAGEDLTLLLELVDNGYGGQPGRDVPVRPQDPGQLQDYVFYLKGAWVLRHLESALGREAFDRALGAYAAATRFADTSTDAFTAAAEAEAGADLGWFWQQWLSSTGFPELAWEPYFRDEATGLQVSLGITQRAGVSSDPNRPWQLPLTWSVQDDRGDPGTPALARDVQGCLREAREVVAPDGLPCGP
ncbi:MAG: M1 family aminopeptidase [Deltaproteobacteria bacterium]|nr:M1 family aminopeptidase [Deltaproteobacteria bacterium]